MGRKNNNYIQIENSIIGLLKDGPASYREIFNYVGDIPKSSFSNIMSSLVTNGSVQVENKIYSLNSPRTFADSPVKQHELRKWLILFVLNMAGEPITLNDICDDYRSYSNDLFVTIGNQEDKYDDEADEPESFVKADKSAGADDIYQKQYEDSVKQGIRIALKKMTDEGIVEVARTEGNKFFYGLTPAAPKISEVDFLELEMLHSYTNCFDVSSATSNLAERIGLIAGGLDCLAVNKFGKQNTVSIEEINTLNQLIKLQYKTKKIEITRNNGKVNVVAIGLIVYSEETNEFYIIGRAEEDVIKNIRLSSVIQMKETGEDNELFENEWFMDYKDELFAVDGGELINVALRFRNTPSVALRVSSMAEGRRFAQIDWDHNEGKEILYKDKVRGMEAFARYIRGFGSDVIVDSPDVLRDRMLKTIDNLNSLYR